MKWEFQKQRQILLQHFVEMKTPLVRNELTTTERPETSLGVFSGKGLKRFFLLGSKFNLPALRQFILQWLNQSCFFQHKEKKHTCFHTSALGWLRHRSSIGRKYYLWEVCWKVNLHLKMQISVHCLTVLKAVALFHNWGHWSGILQITILSFEENANSCFCGPAQVQGFSQPVIKRRGKFSCHFKRGRTARAH